MDLIDRWSAGGAGMYPIAVAGLVGFSVLTGRSQQLISDLDEASVTLLNLMAKARARRGK